MEYGTAQSARSEDKGTTRDDCIFGGGAKSLKLLERGAAARKAGRRKFNIFAEMGSFDVTGRIGMLETMVKKRSCLFCGSACNSREHVIPEWLSKAMKIRDFAFQPAHFTEGKGLELRPQIKCAGFRTRQVCAKCNNGWMSNLEGWAKGKIGNAVAPGFALDSMSELALLEGEIDNMIRWLLKTAIIFELASPRGDLQAVNPDLFPVAAGKAAITDFHVWAGYIPNPNFLVHLTRGFPTWNGGQLAPYQIHSASVDFALQLNHLAIRLIRCPDATAGVKLAHVMTDGNIVIRSVPFILPTPPIFELLHTYLFRDFYAFLDLLEVHVRPPNTESAA